LENLAVEAIKNHSHGIDDSVDGELLELGLKQFFRGH
jgi:hypothetical protein